MIGGYANSSNTAKIMFGNNNYSSSEALTGSLKITAYDKINRTISGTYYLHTFNSSTEQLADSFNQIPLPQPARTAAKSFSVKVNSADFNANVIYASYYNNSNPKGGVGITASNSNGEEITIAINETITANRMTGLGAAGSKATLEHSGTYTTVHWLFLHLMPLQAKSLVQLMQKMRITIHM